MRSASPHRYSIAEGDDERSSIRSASGLCHCISTRRFRAFVSVAGRPSVRKSRCPLQSAMCTLSASVRRPSIMQRLCVVMRILGPSLDHFVDCSTVYVVTRCSCIRTWLIEPLYGQRRRKYWQLIALEDIFIHVLPVMPLLYC